MLKKILSKLKIQNKEYLLFLNHLLNHEKEHEAIIYQQTSLVNNEDIFLLLVIVGNDCLFLEKNRNLKMNLQHIQFNTKDKMSFFWENMIPRVKEYGKVFKDEHVIEYLFEEFNNNQLYYKISIEEKEKFWKLFFSIIRPKNFFVGTISFSPEIGTQLD